MKTRQKQIDDHAVEMHKAVGSNNPGGQDKIDPQRPIYDGVQDGANYMGRKSIMGQVRSQSQKNKEV